MNLYDNQSAALTASDNRELKFIPYECPFSFEKRACGTWCALFEKAEHVRSLDGVTFKRINLRCGDGNKTFQVSE